MKTAICALLSAVVAFFLCNVLFGATGIPTIFNYGHSSPDVIFVSSLVSLFVGGMVAMLMLELD